MEENLTDENLKSKNTYEDRVLNLAIIKYEIARGDVFNKIYSLGRKLNEADVSVVSLDANAKQYMHDLYALLNTQTLGWKKLYYAQWINDFADILKETYRILAIYAKYLNELDLKEAVAVHDVCKRLVSINMLSDNKFDRNAKLEFVNCFRCLESILNLDIIC